ncbi:MAG TPA: Nramp family divalent metal transporter, partial [Pseudoclavibacter sp.]|nr:Nramp family divalent metal transporter [Pseudoclavibacter sp.]
LLWAVITGVVLKMVLVEGAGRYTVATGRTIFEGWRSLGRWPVWYFGPYIVVWGFVYGASAMSSTALPLAALANEVPGLAGTPLAQVWPWAILTGLTGFAFVWLNRYEVFERITAALVGVMFVTIVVLAFIAAPNVFDMLRGLVPLLPEGDNAVFYTLGLAGGVGGTITLAAYGYWLREKGWDSPRFLRVMQLDNAVAYIVTGVFVIAMLIVGAEVVQAAGVAVSSSDSGLLDLDAVLRERYGDFVGVWFLIGFWAAGFSSVLGVWNGVSLMFADFMGDVTGKGSNHPDSRANGKWFRVYLVWLTFPPMLLLFLGQPVFLVLLYGVLGALFMPFLAVTLLPILNTDRVPREFRNRWYTNLALGVTTLIFVALGVWQLISAVGKVL